MSKVIVDTLENTAGTFTSALDSLGSSTTLYDVGTYAFFYEWNGTDRNPGDTRAANASADFHPSNAGGSAAYASITVGTWRCMGYKPGGGTNVQRSTIWVRIS